MTSKQFTSDYYRRRYIDPQFGIPAERRRAYLYRAMTAILRRACPSASTILELGCGVGYLSKHLARLPSGPWVISSDMAPEALRLARADLGELPNVSLCRVDAQALSIRENCADMVVAFDVIEHVPRPELLLTEARRVLRPGGILMLSTPNPGSVGYRIKGHYPEWRGRPLEERALQWFGFRDDTHISIRPIQAWRAALSAAGFTIIRDGTDFLWDTPYVPWLPSIVQKLVLNGCHRLMTRIVGFLPWQYGENYIALCRRMR